MRTVAFVLSILLCASLPIGCGNQSPAPTPAPPSEATTAPAAAPTAAPTPDQSEFGLSLNGGAKWQVDEHTRSVSLQMTALLNEAGPISSVEDARALGSAFDESLNTLIQGCTMTGPAHDELHVFLLELFPRVSTLSSSTDPVELRKTQQDVELLFAAYGRHFE